jgi:hypothetical protein
MQKRFMESGNSGSRNRARNPIYSAPKERQYIMAG